MNHILPLIMSLIIICNNICAQQAVVKYNQLTKKGNVLYLDNFPFTGHAVDYDGNKFDKTKLRQDGYYKNGLANGSLKKWDPDYKLEYIENYAEGEKNGLQTFYFPNGKKWSEFNFTHGKLSDGLHNEWDVNGALVKQVISLGGDVIKEMEFERGAIVKLKEKIIENYSSGNRKLEGWNINGEKNETWTEWFDDGKLKSKGSYLNDKAEGEWVTYNEDGTSLQTYYKNGEIDLFAMGKVKNYLKNRDPQGLSGIYNVVGKNGGRNKLVYIEIDFEKPEAKKYLYGNSIISPRDADHLIKVSKVDYEKLMDDTLLGFIMISFTEVINRQSDRNESRNLNLYTCYEVSVMTRILFKNSIDSNIGTFGGEWKADTDKTYTEQYFHNRNARSSDLLNNVSFNEYISRQIFSITSKINN